jgi:H+-transporting ATPase
VVQLAASPGTILQQQLPPSVTGLSDQEAHRQLSTIGPNALPDTTPNPVWGAMQKLWAPIPWMLESAIVLELSLGKNAEAGIIAVLLAFNAILGFAQESRAQKALISLRSQLALTASVRRNGSWTTLPASTIVPNDIVKLSLGGVVPADVCIMEGNVLLDQSMLTGESIGTEAGAGFRTFAGALVRRGEAVAYVTATGMHTKFGRTAELVRTAHVISSQQVAVMRLVRNLAIFNGGLIALLVGYASFHGLHVSEIIPLVLTAVLASIPVALPATFTLASALGASALTSRNVLPTRLSAIDEAGTIDVLCADKTGTLTANQLAVTTIMPMTGIGEDDLMTMAAFASSEGGQDPVDGAIRRAAQHAAHSQALTLVRFIPFDPSTKMSEASVTDVHGTALRIAKGAYATISAMVPPMPAAPAAAQALEAKGFRVLAVAAGPPAAMALVGLIALSDPARADSASLIAELTTLGIRTIMVTGDAATTATIVAHAVGLSGTARPPGPLPAQLRPEDFSVYAGVLPEDKYALVKAFQAAGHTVGMCGDGANDAPALRQAHIGIAVSTATDVAKSAAGMVLITPGLTGIVAAVKEGRITYQRILSYALNSVTKKIVQVLFLCVGLVMTGHAILSPLLMIIVMLAGDFLGMSLTTDNVRPSIRPNHWNIGQLTMAGFVLGLCELVFCVGIIAIGFYYLRLGTAGLQTLAFVTLVCGNQATMYAIRARGRLWSAPGPSRWLVLSSCADVAIAMVLAVSGVLMAPVHLAIVAGVIIGAVAFAGAVDVVKVVAFRRLAIA